MKLLKMVFIKFGGNFILRERNRTSRIIFWHGVDENPNPIIEAENINKDEFIRQLDYMQKHYEIISIDEFYKRFSANKLNGKEIVLTFDDGYRNNLTVLAPVLRKRKLPFTVFITTSNISNNTLFPTSILRLAVYGSSLKKLFIPSLNLEFMIGTKDDKKQTHVILNKYIKRSPLNVVEEICNDIIANFSNVKWNNIINKYSAVNPLNWDEVRELISFGCTIGSHCVEHICCHSNQKEEEVKYQIIESKKIIENKLGVTCNYFAYPNGDYTDISNKYVTEAGYLMGFSTKKNRVDPTKNCLCALPRIGAPAKVDTFKIAMSLYPKKQQIG